jgi:hypothetical protein
MERKEIKREGTFSSFLAFYNFLSTINMQIKSSKIENRNFVLVCQKQEINNHIQKFN